MPASLQALLAQPCASDVRLVEVGWGGRADFVQARIPGACYIDTSEIERPPLWNRIADDELLAVLLANGIRHDTTVVVYGRAPLPPARLAHLLLYAGVQDVRWLDGGFAAWQRAGLPVEEGACAAGQPAMDFGARFPARPDYMVDIAEAAQLLRSGEGTLVSIRSRAEFTGETSGYGVLAARSDIPGALWGRAGRDGDAHCMREYLQGDGTFRPLADIAAFWREEGIGAQQRIAFYCGTGWRASLAFLVAWLLGWPRIGVYEGGWLEWSGAHLVTAGDEAPAVACMAG